MEVAAGTRLGPYEILAPLGAGGMGEVYRARDERLGREVAIKVLPTSFSKDPDRLRRFEHEARAAGVLNHPNITAVYDIGTHEGAPYVVQELLAGVTPRVILYAFTSSSYALGAEADDPLRARLEKRARGIPVVLTGLAASEALRILGVHRLALIHPPWFTEEVNGEGKDYFRTLGFEVVFCARITPARPFTEMPPAE